MLDRCPLCNEGNTIESISISSQEAYSFNFDLKRGVTLEFFPKAKRFVSKISFRTNSSTYTNGNSALS
jgi:hypothetical protein